MDGDWFWHKDAELSHGHYLAEFGRNHHDLSTASNQTPYAYSYREPKWYHKSRLRKHNRKFELSITTCSHSLC